VKVAPNYQYTQLMKLLCSVDMYARQTGNFVTSASQCIVNAPFSTEAFISQLEIMPSNDKK
jgi:hypothetical protein